MKQIEERNKNVTPSRKNDVAAALLAARPKPASKPMLPKLDIPPAPACVEDEDGDGDGDDVYSEAPSSGPSTPTSVVAPEAEVGVTGGKSVDFGDVSFDESFEEI